MFDRIMMVIGLIVAATLRTYWRMPQEQWDHIVRDWHDPVRWATIVHDLNIWFLVMACAGIAGFLCSLVDRWLGLPWVPKDHGPTARD